MYSSILFAGGVYDRIAQRSFQRFSPMIVGARLTEFNERGISSAKIHDTEGSIPMRRTQVFLILLCVGAGSHAFAADPPAPPSTAQPAQSAPAQSAPAVPATPPVATEVSTTTTPDTVKADPGTKSDVTPEQMKAFRAAGYKPEVHNGRTLFCRREPQIGTRFESKTCGDAAEIERSTRNSQELAERIQSKAYVKAAGNP
jgi:hypothetical protein